MKKIKIAKPAIIKGLIASLIILIIPIVGYIIKSNEDNIWIATFVVQVGVATLWSILKLGLFSTSSYGSRKLGVSLRDRNLNKLGAYTPEKKKPGPASPLELEKKAFAKSWQGVILMLFISVPELLVMLILLFT